ncbi:TetR/AcrR family transcriptional regulator [Antrihabitans sp. YC2-6]|uniref:TetR/AcrR family transcriptional regulator n=1 Tax=Antrihabitans sp. YC2-6 TaxID=2799498 RepID=UPI0018F3885A|nr:TetR/AcrR family transcriptional regulator [Antrihabitans sp. YC2-6]MBJ8348125.1 TetR/AcrR family transcriptional regulator [Antrihabitans sp. YC2-6]
MRNEKRIIEAATQVLAANPAATMTDIADAAELTRVTLYRYYENREALIAAIKAASEAEIAALVARLPSRGPVLPELVALLDDSVALGTRYRYLLFYPRELEVTSTAVEAQTAFAAFIARGQRRGEIDSTFDPHLVSHMFLGLVSSALVPVALGQVTHIAAVEQVSRALSKLLS